MLFYPYIYAFVGSNFQLYSRNRFTVKRRLFRLLVEKCVFNSLVFSLGHSGHVCR